MKNKKVYNFLKCFLNNRKNKIIFGISVLFFAVLITITFSTNVDEEIKQVDFESSGWATQEPGSWHIDKSADWTGERTARVQFDVSTVEKTININKDVILILDISGSMSGSKITKVKSDAEELVESILSNSQNRVALITFDTEATILSNFTDDSNKILKKITTLYANGTTNYTDALRKAEDILENYTQRDNTDLVILFLSDGYPCEETPNQIAEYEVLTDAHPYLTINAIQYEMGKDIIDELKEISHNQYSAYVENLSNVLFDAVLLSQNYDKFVINDFIDERYFELGTIENVNVSIGSASLTIEDGMEKVTWDLGMNYRTGAKAIMTIDLKLKDGVEITDESLFPTNRKEDVTTKLPDEPEKSPVESPKTPKLKGVYKVIYDTNTPNGCSITNPDTETYLVFDTVTMKDYDLSNKCSGYLFKGWEISDESATGLTKVTDNTFIMPSHDVTIKGIWTQVSISKSMTADEYVSADIMPFSGEKAELDTDIDFRYANENGVYIRSGTEENEYPIFYYRGKVDNHVLFANKCWQIVRTTETGGTKLIYNGLPNANGECGYDTSYTTTSLFNNASSALADAGYMYGTRYEYKEKSGGSALYGHSVSYSNGQYTLLDTKLVASDDDSGKIEDRHYTCFSTSNTCTKVNYVYEGTAYHQYYIELEGGKTIETAINDMFANNKDSAVKDYIENTWFAGPDGMLSYDSYLEDTVWCNDRSADLQGGWDPDSTGPIYIPSIGTNEYWIFDIYSRGGWYSGNVNPTLSCKNPNDRFTTSTKNGNGKLKYKVGIITVDEAIFAGMLKMGSSSNSYLSNESAYWTMTPLYYRDNVIRYVSINSNGLGFKAVNDETVAVRPVISLKQGIKAISGDGSSYNPYRIS